MGRWQAFEMGSLLKQPTAAVPVMTYLFHRIEQALDGAPLALTADLDDADDAVEEDASGEEPGDEGEPQGR